MDLTDARWEVLGPLIPEPLRRERTSGADPGGTRGTYPTASFGCSHRRDRKMLFGRFSAMGGIDLRSLNPENHRLVLQALRLRVEVDKNADACISGVFDADITEVLPMAQAPADGPYTVRFNREIPPPFKGVVTLDSTPIAEC